MVDIHITQGQGITQAIKQQIEASGQKITNNDLSIWQQVMTEVKTAQQTAQQSGQQIYSGGDNVEQLNNKNNWKTDFKVAAGQVVQIAADVWNKIVQLLTGKAPENPENNPATADNQQKGTVTSSANQPQSSEVVEDEAPEGTVVGLDNSGISDIVSQPKILSGNVVRNEHPTGPNTPPPVYNETVNPGDLQQAQIAADPLAGQQEDGPVIYQGQESMNVDSQGAAITGEYNYENDAIYQKMSNELASLESDITKFEQENGITQDDPLSESKAMFADGYRDYGTNKYLYNSLKQDYDSYKQVMDNWQDGVKSPSFRQSRNINGRTLINVNYTNVECITLKNGQRAYKTDQGVFYPYTNGYPGNVKVSEELIP